MADKAEEKAEFDKVLEHTAQEVAQHKAVADKAMMDMGELQVGVAHLSGHGKAAGMRLISVNGRMRVRRWLCTRYGTTQRCKCPPDGQIRTLSTSRTPNAHSSLLHCCFRVFSILAPLPYFLITPRPRPPALPRSWLLSAPPWTRCRRTTSGC